MKSAVQKRKCRHLAGIFFLGLALASNSAFAEKTEKTKKNVFCVF
jgi:hypothetical protein